MRRRRPARNPREPAPANALAVIAIPIPPTSKTVVYPLDTEHLFGFTEGAHIGSDGAKELLIDSALREARGTGNPAIEGPRCAAGQFFDLRYRLVDREHAPLGLTVSAAPHRGFVDETSSRRAGHSASKLQLLADRELKRELGASGYGGRPCRNRSRPACAGSGDRLPARLHRTRSQRILGSDPTSRANRPEWLRLRRWDYRISGEATARPETLAL
jgi:hypothetical protein